MGRKTIYECDGCKKRVDDPYEDVKGEGWILFKSERPGSVRLQRLHPELEKLENVPPATTDTVLNVEGCLAFCSATCIVIALDRKKEQREERNAQSIKLAAEYGKNKEPKTA